MYLSYRCAKLGDIENCFPLIADGFAHIGKSRDWLLAFWRCLLAEKTAIGWVIEDHQRPVGEGMVAFGLTLFVDDHFAREIKTTLPPYISVQMIQRWRRGNRVFLDQREIAHQNEKGNLNLLVLHSGLAHTRLTPTEALEVRFKLPESFLAFHRGYRIKEFLKEVYGPKEKASMSQFGFNLLREYPEFVDGNGLSGLAGRPYLFGITREEGQYCERNYGMAQMFNYPAGRFHFSAGEQDVLHQALQGETDEDIAESLGLSLWTIKKRWQEIYAKVESSDPFLLSPNREKEEGLARKRQAKRRPDLMEYLRCHPEEIRPSLSPSYARKGGRPKKKSLPPLPVVPVSMNRLTPTMATETDFEKEFSA
jgi:DNA-binding CsgD family transcriptional regulator